MQDKNTKTDIIIGSSGYSGKYTCVNSLLPARDNLPTTTFIKVLAVIYLIVCALFRYYTIVYEFHLVTLDILCRVCEFMRHCTLFISVITLVAIASERYFAVCKIRTKINVNSINIGVRVIIILAAILGVPAIGTFSVVQDSDVKDTLCHFPHRYTSGIFLPFYVNVDGQTTSYSISNAPGGNKFAFNINCDHSIFDCLFRVVEKDVN